MPWHDHPVPTTSGAYFGFGPPAGLHGGSVTSADDVLPAADAGPASDLPDDLPPPLRDLMAMLGPASVADILGLVEPGWSEDIARLRTAVADGSADAIRDAAHKLKGSAGMCGFVELAGAAEAIEHGAPRGTALAAELARLEILVAEALPRVRAWVTALA